MQLPNTPGDTFMVWVKPKASGSEYVKYWPAREAHVIRVAAVAAKNQANKELLSFLQETYGIRCEIISGLSARKKRLRVY